MSKQARQIAQAALLALILSGCDRDNTPAPRSAPSEAAAPQAVPPPPRATPATKPPPSETAAPAPKPSATASGKAALDMGALAERRSPERVLRFYAAALAAKDWDAAARAWDRGSGVTATTLKAAYDRNAPPALEIGKGEQEGAAGSLYYEAPVALRFGRGMPERGSLVLRRVNDVAGATPAQLRWHIERSTIGQGQ